MATNVGRFLTSLALATTLGATLLWCSSCAPTAANAATPAPAGPEAFLKWSMDQYKAMPSYQVDASVAMDFAGQAGTPPQQRTILIAAPNRFKVVSTTAGAFIQTSVSDGKSLAEYSNNASLPATSYPSPASISEVSSMQMRHPMFCGTLLYQFFGGSQNYAGLVDTTKGLVTFGKEETAQGEKSRAVKFYGTQQYGHVEALIGENTGKVYRIKYDSEPLLKLMGKEGMVNPGKGKTSGTPDAQVFTTVETYSHIASPASIASTAFDTSLPKGAQVQQASEQPSDKPPVPIGSPAPDFEVSTLGGKPVKLSSLRGHPVLIDFWATWCPPCRKGLPETNRISKLGTPQGLQVLAISDEDDATISSFMAKNKYTMAAFHDEGDKAQQAYGVTGIPTTVIIDAKGNLGSYFVGLHPPEDIDSALAKVGIKIAPSG